MRPLTLVIILNICTLLSFGQATPTNDEVSSIANNWLTKNLQKSKASLKSAVNYQVVEIKPIEVDGAVLYHVAQLNPKGFVIVSNNKAIDPVIAYSYNSDFSFSTDSANILYWMLARDLKAREQNLGSTDKWEPEINQLKSATRDNFKQWPEPGTTSTGGWVETTWDQEYPYNKFCPNDLSIQERTPVGCVATAFAQIINYHHYIGDIQFNENDKYSTWYNQKIDGDSLKYDFPSFRKLNILMESLKKKYDIGLPLSDDDKAALSFASTVLVKANFAIGNTLASDTYCENALKNKLNYFSAIFDDFISIELINKMINNIQMAQPCLLGVKLPQGHEVICDGYNNDDYFHFNFGWGSQNPKEISGVWYKIRINDFSGKTVIFSITHDISPVEIKQHIAPKQIELTSKGSNYIKSFIVQAYDKQLSVTKIHCPDPFKISLDSLTFKNDIENISIAPNQRKRIYVRYNAVDNESKSFIEFDIQGSRKEYVNLSGLPDYNIIEGGNVFGEWKDNGKPYLILGDIFVRNNQNLIIDEGVTLYFHNHSSFTVLNGKLVAKGSSDHPILFTALDKSRGWNGLRFIGSGGDDTLKFCMITNSLKANGNTSIIQEYKGGGLFCQNSDPTILNSTISNNKACITGFSNRIGGGGGIYLLNSNAKIIGCTITNNFSSIQNHYGGGIYAENSNPLIMNCVVSKNHSDIAGGIYCQNSKVSIINTAIWDNDSPGNSAYLWTKKSKEIILDDYSVKKLVISNSIVKNNYLSGNISDEDPLFKNPSADYGILTNEDISDWSVKSTSPCINAGINYMNYLALTPKDLKGNKRIIQGYPEIGAIETANSGANITIDCFRELDFKYTLVKDSLVKTVKIYNTGNQNLNINNIELINSSVNSRFSFKNLVSKSFIVKPNDSILINVCYKPLEMKSDSVVLQISSNALDNSVININIHGAGYNGTLVKGEVFGKWTKSNSPYFVCDEIWVKEKDSLIVEGGVEVIFGGNYSFTIGKEARLSMKGTVNDSIKIKTSSGKWNGIKIINSGTDDIFQFTQISGVKSSPAILITNSRPNIYHCFFFENENVIEVNEGNAIIQNCLFVRNKGSVIKGLNLTAYKYSILCTHNEMYNNDNSGTSAISIGGCFISVVSYNKIHDNISLFSPIDFISATSDNSNINVQNLKSSMIYISNNLITNNDSENGLGISTYGTSIIKNNIITNNIGVCPAGSGIITHFGIAYEGSDCTITNNTIAFNNNTYSAIATSSLTRNVNIFNNIIWNNSNNKIDSQGQPLGEIDIRYNCLSDLSNLSVNNFISNPLFKNPSGGIGLEFDGYKADWTLLPGSPCIDAGSPEQQFYDIEDLFQKGKPKSPSIGTLRNDVGAYGDGRNKVPYFQPVTDTTIVAGHEIIIKIKAIDNESPVTFIYSQKLPGWLNFLDNNDGTATISGFSTKSDIGKYQIILSATDGLSEEEAILTFTLTIKVNNAPVANAGIDQSVNEGATVSLDGSASSDPDGNPLTYKWTAPPGITLSSTTVAKPTFTAPEVTANANYTFSLVVNDGTVDSPVDQVVITVKNVNKPPVANAGLDQSINEGTTVSLDGTASSDPDGNPLTYKWTAPAGISLSSTTEAKPSFTTPEVTVNTNYTFSLVVNDGTVDSPADQVVITVKNVNKVPVANAGIDQSVNEGSTVSLDGSTSSDPDGNPITYKWTAPAGITLSSTTTAKPGFTAPEVTINTNYTFSLVVNDGTVDSPVDQVVITVKNVNKAPVANAGIDQSINEGATVSLDGSLSSDPDGNPLTYKWTAPAGITLSSTTTAKPIFIAPEVTANTNYTFSLVVNDGTIDSPVDQVVITVKNVNKAPVANAGIDQSVNEGTTVSLDGSASSDPDGNPLTYKWTAPAGITLSSTTASKPTFKAPEVKKDSTLSFSLIVNDGLVSSLQSTVKVTVLNVVKVEVTTIGSPLLKVYPNPTTGIVNIEISGGMNREGEIVVTNLAGAEVFRKEIIGDPKVQIDLSKQVNGIYMLKIMFENQQYISKIVIKRD